MSTHTIKGYIVYETWSHDKQGKYVFQPYQALKETQGYTQVPVCQHDLTFDVPADFDPRPAQVKALQEQKAKAAAAYAAMVKELDDRINSLLALEMSA